MILLLLAILLAFIGFVVGAGASYTKQDIQRYNHGICPKCGRSMKSIFTDSQGGVQWECDCGYWANIDESVAKLYDRYGKERH